MNYEHICHESNDSIAIVTLNRPQRRNALSLALMQELIHCLSEIGRRPDLRAVILASTGNVFSSGHDLSEMVGRDRGDYQNIFDVCTELIAEAAIDSTASDRARCKASPQPPGASLSPPAIWPSLLRLLHLPRPE